MAGTGSVPAVPHFANFLVLMSRHRVAGSAATGGHLMNLPLSSRHCCAASALLAPSTTIAQDEATSVVWGMPGEATAIGAAGEVLPLNSIAGRILALSQSMDITRQ